MILGCRVRRILIRLRTEVPHEHVSGFWGSPGVGKPPEVPMRGWGKLKLTTPSLDCKPSQNAKGAARAKLVKIAAPVFFIFVPCIGAGSFSPETMPGAL